MILERRTMAAALAACLAVVVIVASCGGTATPTPPLMPSAPTTVTPAPSASVPATEAPTPTLLVTPLPTAAPSASPEPTASPAAGFACAYPFDRPASSTAMAHVSDVAVGSHDSYDRVVFDFTGSAVPELQLEQVSPPFEKDPSGLPLTVPGTAFVRIALLNASGEGYANPDGKPTYTGPSSFNPGYPQLTSLVRAGDFEGTVTWIAGLTGPACYHVTTLTSPTRLVIDLRAAP